MMIIQKKSYIFGRNAGECSFLGLYSMENPLASVTWSSSYYKMRNSKWEDEKWGGWGMGNQINAWIKIKTQNLRLFLAYTGGSND